MPIWVCYTAHKRIVHAYVTVLYFWPNNCPCIYECVILLTRELPMLVWVCYTADWIIVHAWVIVLYCWLENCPCLYECVILLTGELTNSCISVLLYKHEIAHALGCIGVVWGPFTHIRVINCLLYLYDVLYLHFKINSYWFSLFSRVREIKSRKKIQSILIHCSLDTHSHWLQTGLGGWFSKFANINNKQKPPVTNFIFDQI